AVFSPFAFATGHTDRLFVEFALTLAGAVIISGFVALTLSPAMCARMLKHHDKHHWLYNLFERGIAGLTPAYRVALTAVLSARPLIVIVFLALAGTVYYLGHDKLKEELAPTEDRGFLMGIMLAPEGSTIGSSEDSLRRLEAIYDKVPEKNRYFVVMGYPVLSQRISS